MVYSGFVALALIRNKKGKYLMVNLRRINAWGLPGGKVELGERPREALPREVEEELGIKIRIGGLAGIRESIEDDGIRYWTYVYYSSEVISGEIEIKEPNKISEVAWKDKKDLPKGVLFIGKPDNLK